MDNNQWSAWSFVCCVFSPAVSLCKKKEGRAQLERIQNAALPAYLEGILRFQLS